MLTFQIRLLLALIAFGVLIGGTALLLTYKMEEFSIKANSIEKAVETFAERSRMFEDHIADLRSMLLSIEDSAHFKRYLADECLQRSCIEDLFLTLMGSSSKFMQMRYIDKSGVEKLRIDRKSVKSRPLLLPEDRLQDKSDRYYFTEIMALKDDVIWYSEIDLNMEHGEIELPIRPVLRIGKRVTFKGTVQGILIINVFMEEFLQRLTESTLYDLYLIDKNGYFLSHPDHSKSWSRYLGTGFSVEKSFPESGDCILNNSVCELENLYAADIAHLHNDDRSKLIVKPRLYSLQTQIAAQAKQLLYVVVALLLLAFPLAFLFSRTPLRLSREIEEMNIASENKIAEKVHEMEDLNDALEKKVKARTEELEVTNAKLLEQATTDVLTGIANRRFFFEMCDRYLQLAHRKRHNMALVLFDIDFFKNVNDSHGHQVGDEVLRHVVERITTTLRKSDLIGRIGGEEFAVVLPENTLEEAKYIAQKVCQVVAANPYEHKGSKISLTVSAGVAQTFEDESDMMTALSRADAALYRAKAQGRDQVFVMEDEKRARS